jgi:hypothetical protein
MTITTSTAATAKLAKLEAFARGHRTTIAEMLLGESREAASARDIAGELNRLASIEGEIHVWRILVRLLDAGRDESEISEAITALLLTGADDAWAGRSNDARRAHFDGIRQAARSVGAGWAW